MTFPASLVIMQEQPAFWTRETLQIVTKLNIKHNPELHENLNDIKKLKKTTGMHKLMQNGGNLRECTV